MSPDDFSKVAGGIQSVVTVIAIIVAGIWAIYTFRALGTTQKARAEITELEQNTVEQPILMISFDWAVFDGGPKAGYPVSLAAHLANSGKRALEFSNLVAVLDRRGAAGGVDAAFKPIVVPAQYTDDGGLHPMPPRTLRGGQARTVAFLLPRLSAGDYFIQVKTVYSGMVLRDGEFVPSSDVPIDALEQTVVHVP